MTYIMYAMIMTCVSCLFNPFTSSKLFYYNSLDLFPIGGCLVNFYYYFIEIPVHYANSAGPDQSLPSAASDLYLHHILNTFDLYLTLLLLNTTCPVLANSADPDQLASEEAN